MDYMAYSHMFMANEAANEDVEDNLPNFELEWKKLFGLSTVVTGNANDLPKFTFHWLNFLKSSAWLALAGMSIFFATVSHAQTASVAYVTTNGSCLRVREDANLYSRVLDCIPNRTQITTTETINGFARLSPSGFVSSKWIGNTPNNRPVNTGSNTGGRVLLSFGSRGSAVSEVQRALGVQPTGYYGSTTTRVVRQFQSRNNLRVDGIVGPRTRNAIFRNNNYGGTGGQVLLSFGSRGPAVSEVQRALGVQPTGYYGSTTTRVVRQFQSRNNLRVDGIVGPRTRNAIFRNY
ncbi:peptidoglycan-binding protein [Nodularia harveyana UHCC-0300]|uniref:Peptidoglycan-binding protein n=1 Tax=Nodularia harveyana UHCC-0300 TaxID=2974287 RepID=A0ABU5UC99_9CYAN|nr:peptidoglycan-binding protein [Nodularia harveyana]MEA5581137.1 peptidoglycan-binding protein [Nodularia harveyana UHCC-0300]